MSIVGLSVGVDIFTLIFISIERYLAICRPLLILKLQSLPFTNLLNSCILIFIWLSALLIALPNFYIYHLCSLPKAGRFKCEKAPPSDFIETVYMIALDCMKNFLQTKKKTNSLFSFSFLFYHSNVGYDRSLHGNYLENVSK